MPTPQELLEALKQVKYPGFSRDIVAFGMVKDIAVGGAGVTVQLAPPTDNAEVVAQIHQGVIDTLVPLVQVPVEVVIQRPATAAPLRSKPGIPGVQHIVAVASGKGGGWQVDRRGQPGLGSRGARPAGGAAGCGCLRAQCAPDAGD